MTISRIKTNSIEDSAVTGSKVATGGIATVDMADGSVTSLKIADGGVGTADIANSAVTPTKLSSDAQYMGFKNRIINGAMMIDQRNAGASVTPTASAYTLDRWSLGITQASKASVQQSSTAPAGFVNSLVATSLSSYSVVASDLFVIQQIIEGFNIADLGWGTANAQPITLSFWVRSSLTGTFGGAINNSGASRSYPFTYTISAANTWEQKTVTVAGDTSGTWLTTNGFGIGVRFGLGCGSTYSGTAGAWAGATYYSATGATSVVGTNGATFYITGVQLEKGSAATSFDYRPYGTELQLCQRYYESYSYNDVSVAAGTPNALKYFFSFAVAKRTAPTMSLPASTNQGLNKTNGATLTPAYAWTSSGTVNGFQIYAGDANIGGFVAGTATASAEL